MCQILTIKLKTEKLSKTIKTNNENIRAKKTIKQI